MKDWNRRARLRQKPRRKRRLRRRQKPRRKRKRRQRRKPKRKQKPRRKQKRRQRQKPETETETETGTENETEAVTEAESEVTAETETETEVTFASSQDAQFALTKQLFPEASTVGVIYSTDNKMAKTELADYEALAKEYGYELVTTEVTTAEDIDFAASELVGGVDGVFCMDDATLNDLMQTDLCLCGMR
ncbi:MAG: ABC transporter substrate binding protein [Lachnospiraceae bacterium]